jgi:hypothetical protein
MKPGRASASRSVASHHSRSPSLSRPSPSRCGCLRCGDGLPRCREPLAARRLLHEDAYRLGQRTAGVDVKLTALRIALALAAWTSSSQPDSSSTSCFPLPLPERPSSKNLENPSPSWITRRRFSMTAERSPFGSVRHIWCIAAYLWPQRGGDSYASPFSTG